MITPKRVFVISMAVFGAYCVARANAANSPGALSQYGQIQAVKNYSSNPYWNPNSPYNQKAIPKAIYVTGADLTTEDCNKIVDGLVSDLCSLNNNCSNMRLADVRPTIMVQLSQLPGHNYATACSGYIDAAFDKYAQTSITITAPLTTNTTTNHYTFQNPYAPKLNAYQAGVLERTKELEQLQAQTAASAQINSADFPKTVADISFIDRMANAAAGYEPYKDKSAYKIPNFETEKDFNKRLKTQNLDEYCTRFPNDADCKCVLNPEDPACISGQNNNDSQNTHTNTSSVDDLNVPVPSCIQNLASFTPFRTTIRKALEHETIIDEASIKRNKNALYPIIAKEIVSLCVTQGSAIKIGEFSLQRAIPDFNLDTTPITEFNAWLYSKQTIPVPLPVKKGKDSVVVDISATELLSYAPIPTSVLVINRTDLSPYDSFADVTVDREYFFSDKCSDRSIGGHSDHSTTIHRAARAAGFKHNCENGLTFFLDYPLNKERRVFPGVLLESCASFLGQEHLIAETNYAKALSTVRKFVDNINEQNYGAQCSNQNLAVYVIVRPLPADRIKTVRRESPQETVYILAGPYLIP